MKPIQPHKDPRVTNISFDNFTGSICIITPLSDEDEEDKELMLSSPQNQVGADLFKPNHHVSLITQPVLGARSRKKDKTDSTSNSRRSSYNDTSLLTLPITRVEKKANVQESSDSGLDFSLSTNSSVQYSQQQPIIHRPLSALNEDSNADDGFYEQQNRFPVINPGHYYSMENDTKKSTDESHSETNTIQQHRSLNDLTNIVHSIPPKPLRKKTKLNIIIEPSISSLSSSRLNIHDEQIHRIPSSSSSNQTTSLVNRTRNPPVKPKAITPLGHYPNQEQIRAHINRSVIERQHPPYAHVSPRKPQNLPFDPTKANKLLSRPVKQQPTTNIYRPSNIHGGNSTIQNLHATRPPKTILPDLHHEERRFNEKEAIRNKEPVKINPKREHLDNFLTSTPRHHFEPTSNFKGQQPSIYPKYKSKPVGYLMQNKTRTINPEPELSPRNQMGPFQTPSNKRLRMPYPEHQTNTNNIPSKISFIELSKEQKISNRFFQARSPTCSQISEHHHHYHYEPSPSPHDEPNQTYRLTPTLEQPLLDGRHVIPSVNPKPSIFVDCASQTSAPYVESFTHTSDPNNDTDVDASPSKLNDPDNFEHQSCSSSSLDRFTPHDRFPLPLGKLTVAMEEDDLSSNYDSDDGWSDDSAELIYADERYLTQKKKNIISTSSSSLQPQNVLLQ